MARRNSNSGSGDRLSLQPRGMPAQMILHEGGNEVVAVVVAAVETKDEGDFRLRTCLLEQFQAKLLHQERVGIAAIDEKIGKPGAVLDQRDGVMLAPRFPAIAEITPQRLDAPRYLRGRHDWRKSAGGAVTIGVAQRDGQRAVAA